MQVSTCEGAPEINTQWVRKKSNVSDVLLAELQAKAQAAGKTVDELAEEALRNGLGERDWQDLLVYGRQTGRESGYSEPDVPEVVRKRRRINAAQRR